MKSCTHRFITIMLVIGATVLSCGVYAQQTQVLYGAQAPSTTKNITVDTQPLVYLYGGKNVTVTLSTGEKYSVSAGSPIQIPTTSNNVTITEVTAGLDSSGPISMNLTAGNNYKLQPPSTPNLTATNQSKAAAEESGPSGAFLAFDFVVA